MHQYRYWVRQADKLVELQEDYHTYIAAVNDILDDYNNVKELQDSRTIVFQETEKKNDVWLAYDDLFVPIFPQNALLFSTNNKDQCDSFILLNRDLDYLKIGALEHINTTIPELCIQIDVDAWRNYTNDIIEAQRKQAEQKKKKSLKKKKVTHSRTRKKKSQPKPVISQKKKQDIQLSWPIDRDKFWLSSLFGRRKNKGRYELHLGIDMAALKDTPIKAAEDGHVIEAGYIRGYGNTVVIVHNRKYKTRYAHLHRIKTKVGRKVKQGQIIGKVGNTGNVRSSKKGRDPSHLHFEVIRFNQHINPLTYLS
jgi:murein DD-endopeptidase MepM/ murein hydrolase activator NlpD